MKNILIVDDEIEIVKIWQELFQILELKTYTAPTKTAGIEVLKEVAIDLIITDLKGSRTDRTTLLDYVQEMKSPPKIIISSGFFKSKSLGNKYTIEKFIPKPFDVRKELIYLNDL